MMRYQVATALSELVDYDDTARRALDKLLIDELHAKYPDVLFDTFRFHLTENDGRLPDVPDNATILICRGIVMPKRPKVGDMSEEERAAIEGLAGAMEQLVSLAAAMTEALQRIYQDLRPLMVTLQPFFERVDEASRGATETTDPPTPGVDTPEPTEAKGRPSP